MTKPTGKAAEAAARAQVQVAIVVGSAKVLQTLIRWLGIAIWPFFIYKCIEKLSGEKTFADIAINVAGKFWISQGLAWLLAVAGFGYGRRQRHLRHRAIARSGPRIKKLESAIDSKRSSSQLDDHGHTPPED